MKRVNKRPVDHFEGKWEKGKKYTLYAIVKNNGTLFRSLTPKEKEEPYVYYDSTNETFSANPGWEIVEMSEDSRMSAIGGDGGGSDPEAVKYTPQSLTDEQKAQARENIGAASSADVESTYARKTELSQLQRVTDSLNEAVNEGDIYLEKSYNTAYLYLEEEGDTIECRWDESGTYTFPKVEGYNTMEVYCPGGPGGANLRLYKKVDGENIPVLFMGWLMEYDEAFPGTGIYLFGNPDNPGYGVYDAIKGEWIRGFEGPYEDWPFSNKYTLDINDYFADSDQMVFEKRGVQDSVQIIDPNSFVTIPYEIVSNTLLKRQYPVNADWSEEDPENLAYIRSKPIIPPAQFQNHTPDYNEVEGDIRIQKDETEYIDYENGGMPTKDGFLITIYDEMNTDVKVYQAIPTQVNYGTEEDPDYGTEYEKGTLILRGRMYYDDFLDGQYVHGFYFTDSNNHIVSSSPRPGGGRYIPYTSIFGSDPITAIIAEGSDFDLVCCSPTGGYVEKFDNAFYLRTPYPGVTNTPNGVDERPISSMGVFNTLYWEVHKCQNNGTLQWNRYYYVEGGSSYLTTDLTLSIEKFNAVGRGSNNKIILNIEINDLVYLPTLTFTDANGNPIIYWKDGKFPSSINQSGLYTIVFEHRKISGDTLQIVGSIEEWIMQPSV